MRIIKKLVSPSACPLVYVALVGSGLCIQPIESQLIASHILWQQLTLQALLIRHLDNSRKVI